MQVSWSETQLLLRGFPTESVILLFPMSLMDIVQPTFHQRDGNKAFELNPTASFCRYSFYFLNSLFI